MKILFLSRWFPFPTDNGSKLRIYNLLHGLAPHHDVTLLSFTDKPIAEPYPVELTSFCRKIRTVPLRPFRPRGLRSLAGYFASVPRSAVDTFSREMQNSIESELSRLEYDLVIASQVDTASYARYFQGLPALFEEAEVAVIYERYTGSNSRATRFRNYLTWFKQKRYLDRLMKFFSACTVVSDPERDLLLRAVHSVPSIEVIPNCVNLRDYDSATTEPRANSLIFAGSLTYVPNYEGMTWYLRNVHPALQKFNPDIQLAITGDHTDLPLPPADNLQLTGWVQDVRPLIQSSWASIVPIQTGGGTRLKILESMALGTPVISTSKGAEGLEVEPGIHMLIADTPSDFAESIHSILRSPELRNRLSQNALELLRNRYDWSVVMPRFLDLIQRIA